MEANTGTEYLLGLERFCFVRAQVITNIVALDFLHKLGMGYLKHKRQHDIGKCVGFCIQA